MTDQVAPHWRALVTAAARVASAAPACWWAVAIQPRTSNPGPAGSGTGVWPLPRVERAALQDGHSATAPYWTVAVSMHHGRRAGSSAQWQRRGLAAMSPAGSFLDVKLLLVGCAGSTQWPRRSGCGF